MPTSSLLILQLHKYDIWLFVSSCIFSQESVRPESWDIIKLNWELRLRPCCGSSSSEDEITWSRRLRHVNLEVWTIVGDVWWKETSRGNQWCGSCERCTVRDSDATTETSTFERQRQLLWTGEKRNKKPIQLLLQTNTRNAKERNPCCWWWNEWVPTRRMMIITMMTAKKNTRE